MKTIIGVGFSSIVWWVSAYGLYKLIGVTGTLEEVMRQYLMCAFFTYCFVYPLACLVLKREETKQRDKIYAQYKL